MSIFTRTRELTLPKRLPNIVALHNLPDGETYLDGAFKQMSAEDFAHKPRIRTYETVYRQYVENRESINSTTDLLREQCALEETLIAELDALMAIAKADHETKLQEIATVEASIPRKTPEGLT